MKQLTVIMMVAVALYMGQSIDVAAKNKQTTYVSVKDLKTITEDIDLVISGSAPFGDEGMVNIVNTEHAVLIVEKKKPSEMLKLLPHVQINGKAAKNGSNCQVKIYNRGSIVLPYGESLKPLTCYTEPDFQGTAYNNYTLGTIDGYMKTLTANSLKNKIRSFKLKRGYMVTFSTLDEGRGYSRCFIAADKDLEIKELPLVLDRKINSYRIFKWYDAGKKQLANEMNKKPLTALNVQSSYDWGQGNDSFAPDIEWVPNHIYEDWPSSATIGSTNQSPHCKNNNEPRNSADDHPQDLKTILDNWENMMRTGLRLCSPASWDGSDYWNATGFLADFLDSIDARGWRCDIIDLHCYWSEPNFGNIANWYNKYKRPIWISEWCWGASWNHNGAFASGVTQSQVKSALQNICTNLNGWGYVERYYYWNGEAVISRLYDYNDNPRYPIYDNGLTPAGEYYASMTSPIAYDGKHDFVPRNPPQSGPSNYKETLDDGKITKISWHDSNGEYNQVMEVHKKGPNGWVVDSVLKQKETAGNYSMTIKQPEEGVKYRVYLVDLNGKAYYTGDDSTPAVSAIRLPNVPQVAADGFYTLDGLSVDKKTMHPGVYIKVASGHASKYIMK